MSDQLHNPADVRQSHALVHFFALLAAIEEMDEVMRLLASGVASLLPVDAVALGCSSGGANTFKIYTWHRGVNAELQKAATAQESMQSIVSRAMEDLGYSLHKSMALVHLGKTIGYLAVARREPAQLTSEEDFLLASLQTLSSLLLAKHGADEALRHSQQWLRVTLTSIGDAVMTTDAQGRVTFLNPVAEGLSGWRTQDAVGKPIQDVFRIVNQKSGQPAADIVEVVLRDHRVVALANDTALLTKDDRQIPIEDSAAPIRDAKGNLVGVVLVFHDVSERRRAQEALRESEQRVRLKLDSILSPEGDIGKLELGDVINVPALQALMDEFYALTHMPIGIIDVKGKVLVGVGWQDICTKFHRVNPESCKHCVESDVELSAGVPPGEFKLYHCKNHMWDVATPITVGGKHVGNLFSGQFFFEGERPDYELFRTQARQYGFEEKKYLAALDRVTRLKRETMTSGMTYLTRLADMISKLSYSNVKLAHSLAEQKRDEEEISRQNRTLDGINRIFREAMQCETEEELGTTCLRVAEEITGSKLGFIGEIDSEGLLHDLAISETGWELCVQDDKTGHRLPAKFRIRGLYGRVLKDGRGLLTNSPAEHPDSAGTPAGHPKLTAVLAAPLLDGTRVTGVIAVANRDGGYQHEDLESLEALAPAIVEALHRKRTERALIRSEKLVSVGRLAATIAHEVNNPLAGATNALYLLAQEKSLSRQGRTMADIAERELRRAAQVSRRILGFYREPSSGVVVGMTELVNDLVALYEPRLKDRAVELRVRCADDRASVLANPGEMRQLFSNLLANSIDAIGQAGTVHIRVRPCSLNGAPFVRVTVADTGSGIAARDLRRLFEPFFTTKKDVGSGLGLWICQQIARRHGGKISVRSRLGRGTVFSVRLPGATTAAAPTAGSFAAAAGTNR